MPRSRYSKISRRPGVHAAAAEPRLAAVHPQAELHRQIARELVQRRADARDAQRRRVVTRHREIVGRRDGGARRIGVGDNETRKPPGKRRLADAFGAAEDEHFFADGDIQVAAGLGGDDRLIVRMLVKILVQSPPSG